MTCSVDAVLHTVEQGMPIARVVELAIIQHMILLLWLKAVYISTVRDVACHVERQELRCNFLVRRGGSPLRGPRLKQELIYRLVLLGEHFYSPRVK